MYCSIYLAVTLIDRSENFFLSESISFESAEMIEFAVSTDSVTEVVAELPFLTSSTISPIFSASSASCFSPPFLILRTSSEFWVMSFKAAARPSEAFWAVD